MIPKLTGFIAKIFLLVILWCNFYEYDDCNLKNNINIVILNCDCKIYRHFPKGGKKNSSHKHLKLIGEINEEYAYLFMTHN